MHSSTLGVAFSALLLAFNVTAASQDVSVKQGQVFARINDLSISQDEFEAIFQAAVRHRYYHGKVPAEELIKFRNQVADDIVIQALVYQQALQQGMKPDRKRIDEGIDAFDSKNAGNQNWETRREQVIPRLIERLERQDLIEKLEQKIRDVEAPDNLRISKYYQDNPEKFTEPKRFGVSVILLNVPPSASEDDWIETQATMAGLKQRIESGEDFAALAKKYSGHPSAVNGGDLGYLHLGVIEAEVQKKIEGLAINQLSDPLRVLEGITLFQLNGVQPPNLKPFDEVKGRAAELLYREMQDSSWNRYLEELRSAADVYVRNK